MFKLKGITVNLGFEMAEVDDKAELVGVLFGTHEGPGEVLRARRWPQKAPVQHFEQKLWDLHLNSLRAEWGAERRRMAA